MKERIRQTMITTYGAAIPLQVAKIKEKKDKTCERLYGDKDIMHNAEIYNKVVKNSFLKKEYTLPSGKVVLYQGYENMAWDELLTKHKEEEIVSDPRKIPRFQYSFQDKVRRYYPDLYLPLEKRIIEMKSTYTYRRQLEQNRCKRDSVLAEGYSFKFWICDNKQILRRLVGKEE